MDPDKSVELTRSGKICVDVAPDQERVGLFALVFAASLSETGSLALIERLELRDGPIIDGCLRAEIILVCSLHDLLSS